MQKISSTFPFRVEYSNRPINKHKHFERQARPPGHPSRCGAGSCNANGGDYLGTALTHETKNRTE
jgi:hypothetical protein